MTEARVDDGAVLLRAGGPVELTREQVRRDVFGLRRRVPHGGTVALRAVQAPLVVAALHALDGWAARVELVGDLRVGVDPGTVVLDDADADADAVPEAPRQPPGGTPVDTVWRLYTSGTTGAPKHADHALSALLGAVRRTSSRHRWGLLYPPTRMAGLQVLLQVLHGGGDVCAATHLGGMGERIAWLAANGVDALSATPTAWRQVLQSEAGPDLPLRQVTLGGEIATQPLLDALRRAYPDARITHVYATTETGSAFAVSDGRAGFPAALLGTTLRVRDGVLRVHAPAATAAGPDGYVTTGDLVEVEGDRVHFRGRASGLANVGGQKVSPEQTEALLRTHPLVLDARVTARRNAFAGAVLVADVLVADPAGVDEARLTAELRALVARSLTKAHAPARVRVVAELPTTTTGKVIRA